MAQQSDLDLIEAFIADELAVRLDSYCDGGTPGNPDRSTCAPEHLPFLEEAEAALAAAKRLRERLTPAAAEAIDGREA